MTHLSLAGVPLDSFEMGPASAFELGGLETPVELLRQWAEALVHYSFPVTRISIASEFMELYETWHEDTMFSSSIEEIASHPAYHRIIALGAPALPLILAQLEASLDHWFVALVNIAGENPVAEADRGNLEAMRAAWLDWGRQRGLIA